MPSHSCEYAPGDHVANAYVYEANVRKLIALQSVSRPFGVTLLAVLHILQTIMYLIVGVALIALGILLPRFLLRLPRVVEGIVAVIGGAVIVIALVYLLLAYGLWTGRVWAWTISLVLAGLAIIFSLIALVARGGVGALVTLILNAVVVYYLLRPKVKLFFGKAQPAHVAAKQATTQPPPMATLGAPRFCPNCGAPVTTDVQFCSHCGAKLA